MHTKVVFIDQYKEQINLATNALPTHPGSTYAIIKDPSYAIFIDDGMYGVKDIKTNSFVLVGQGNTDTLKPTYAYSIICYKRKKLFIRVESHINMPFNIPLTKVGG